MNRLDFRNRDLLDKYYKEKFIFDISNYFVVNGWRQFNYKKDFIVDADTYIMNLHSRGRHTFDGDPAIYMGCGPWWNVVQNYEFSGIFAFLYIASKCIRKHCGNEKAFEFCQKYCFPLIDDKQTCEDFDVVATLKEACIAPLQVEAENYTSMLNVVVPFMIEQTIPFIGKCPLSVREEINKRITAFRHWVDNTQDELVSFHGMKFRREYMSSDSLYPTKYFQLDSWMKLSNRYNVYSFNDIAKLKLKPVFAASEITDFDGPIVPHFDDLDFMIEQERKIQDTSIEDELFKEASIQDDNENTLYNILLNVLWDDEPFIKDGRTGLKDCWGRIIVPAEYEGCEGIHDGRFIHHENICISVKEGGKWAFLRRKNYHEQITDFLFDDVDLTFQGYYSVKAGNKYGLYNQSGMELIQARMEDIYHPTVCEWHIMYKEDGKYGILYNNGIRTKELAEDIDLESGHLLSVKVNGRWGYYSEDGNFTQKRKEAYLTRNGFNLDSMVKYKHGFPSEFDPDNPNLDGCVPIEEFQDELIKDLRRFSERIDFRESCLEGKAKVGMGIEKNALFYTILPNGPTFCIDMERPYLLKLLDDRYHDMVQSWNGYEKEKEQLKNWMNEKNRKTGVRNWAECLYEKNCCLKNASKPLVMSYAYRKTIDISLFSDSEFEQYEFPEIQFES